MNDYIINLLVLKIKNKEINPKTNKTFEIEDIKIENIKQEVENMLISQ